MVVIERLGAGIRLLHDGERRLGLLPHLVGRAYLFGAGAARGLALHGRSGIAGGLGLRQFGLNVGRLEECQRVAGMYRLAFTHPDGEYAARHLARHAVFIDIYLALDGVVHLAVGIEAHQDGRRSDDKQNGYRRQEI